MPNEYINKVVFGSDTLIDLTKDTVDASKLLEGYTAHDKSGATIIGTCDFDSNTMDADASADEILANKKAYVKGTLIKGSMADQSDTRGEITSVSEPYSIPAGYHDGSSTVSISEEDKSYLVEKNIRTGITILGVTGTMTGTEDVKAQEKTVTPLKDQEIAVVPESPDYNYLSKVIVKPVPYTLVDNEEGGQTAMIATAASIVVMASKASRVVR